MKMLKDLIAEGRQLLAVPDIASMRERHRNHGGVSPVPGVGNKDEGTTSVNVGYYETPLGSPQRAAFPHPEGVLGDYAGTIERVLGKKVKRKMGAPTGAAFELEVRLDK